VRDFVHLIGFMGAGKSTVGQRLAVRADRPYLDLDARVAEAAGRSVPAIFETEGEEGFRRRERTELGRILEGPPGILATGGGTVEEPALRALLRGSGMVVWLDLRFETVRARLLADGPGRRPLLDHLGLEGLARLHRRRRPLYAATAHLRLDADRSSPHDLARLIHGLVAELEASR
jgi:shikimate kinase